MLRLPRWSELFGLAWPISATLLVRITMRTVDLVVVGAVVGAVGVSAVGIGDTIARLLLFTALGLGAGTIATVSQATGGHRDDEAAAATTQTALLAAAVGTVLGAVLWWLAPVAYDLLGSSDEVSRLGVSYLRIVVASSPARFLAIMLTRAFQGVGDTRTPLWVRGGGTLLNIALTIVLVPGLAGLPELGVRGAAIATAIGIIGFLVGVSWLLGVGLGLGVAGVFVGVLLDPLVRTGILARWFERGRWRRTLADTTLAA